MPITHRLVNALNHRRAQRSSLVPQCDSLSDSALYPTRHFQPSSVLIKGGDGAVLLDSGNEGETANFQHTPNHG